MHIKNITNILTQWASPTLQESYDNVGLITGNNDWACTGVLCTLDVTEQVVDECIALGYNIIVAHHPIIFKGLKKINGNSYVEKIIIKAIKHDIAIYAIHTNLDNVLPGVNSAIANKLGLLNLEVLVPKQHILQKIYTYIPEHAVEKVKTALFAKGAGTLGNYSQCSFSTIGTGTFMGNASSKPVIGKPNVMSTVPEVKVEIIYPNWLQYEVICALKAAHPYEEVAYEIISTHNVYNHVGSGAIGNLSKPVSEKVFFGQLKAAFNTKVIRHSVFLDKKIQKVAICGGSGSAFIHNAMAAQADVYITADVKYHEFFEANNQIIIADIGHWESEQYTTQLIFTHLRQNFPNFAIQKARVKTNSTYYHL